MKYLILPLILLAGCGEQPNPATDVKVEVVLNDLHIPRVGDARVIILPSGERVLVMTGPDGLATCCLLPPLKVEKP